MKKINVIVYSVIFLCLSLSLHGGWMNNHVYINWCDNDVCEYDFNSEISESIKNGDTCFIDQLVAHKAFKNKSVVFTQKHLLEAIKFRRSQTVDTILSLGDASITNYVQNNDVPLTTAVENWNPYSQNIQDDQDAIFIVGLLLARKTEYHGNIIELLSNKFSNHEAFRYMTLHLPHLKKSINDYVSKNAKNGPRGWESVVIQYAKQTKDIAAAVFDQSENTPLRRALLIHCKDKLGEYVPQMSYEDKKLYCSDNKGWVDYDRLSAIISDVQAEPFITDVLVSVDRNSHQKKPLLMPHLSNLKNISSVISLLMRSDEKLRADSEVLGKLQKIAIDKVEKSALEDMVIKALKDQEYQHADIILAACPLLSDSENDVQECVRDVRDQYLELQQVMVACSDKKKHVLPMCQKKFDVASHVLFFDRVLGHSMWNVHKDKPAIVTACNNVRLLNEAKNYLEALRNLYDYNCEQMQKCSICFDQYGSKQRAVLCRKQKHTVCFSWFNNPSKQRAVLCCKQKHTVCFSCFNNPSLLQCPTCREELSYNKLVTCQECSKDNDLRFVHCNECNVVSVTCADCITFLCCNKEKKTSHLPSATSSSHIARHATAMAMYMNKRCDQRAKAVDKEGVLRSKQLKTELHTALQEIEAKLLTLKDQMALYGLHRYNQALKKQKRLEIDREDKTKECAAAIIDIIESARQEKANLYKNMFSQIRRIPDMLSRSALIDDGNDDNIAMSDLICMLLAFLK